MLANELNLRKNQGDLNIEDLKREFMNNEIWILTFGGAFQRSKIYKDDISSTKRKKFRNKLKEYVHCIVGEYYVKVVDEEKHIKNIINLCDWATKNHHNILKDGKLRIGIGQKILNLYLKYLWCLGKITKPPHCPIDRKIISKIESNSSTSWTEIDDIEEYKRLINLAKVEADSKSLAEWELENFERN